MLVYLGASYLLVLAGTAGLTSAVFRVRWHLSDLSGGRGAPKPSRPGP
jgi:hypothetical protein